MKTSSRNIQGKFEDNSRKIQRNNSTQGIRRDPVKLSNLNTEILPEKHHIMAAEDKRQLQTDNRLLHRILQAITYERYISYCRQTLQTPPFCCMQAVGLSCVVVYLNVALLQAVDPHSSPRLLDENVCRSGHSPLCSEVDVFQINSLRARTMKEYE